MPHHSNLPATLQDFKIQNIVGSCDVKFPIRLEGLSYTHSMFSSVRGLCSTQNMTSKHV